MSIVVKIKMKNLNGIVIAIAIVIAAILYAYFNPYQSCKRDLLETQGVFWTAKICSGSG